MKAYRIQILAVALLSLIMLGGCATSKPAKMAGAEKADTSWMFHDIVDVKFIAKYAKMPRPENVVIIDSRPKKGKFDKGYIPTAISIPDSQFAKMTDKLPKDKNTLLIFYCQGPT